VGEAAYILNRLQQCFVLHGEKGKGGRSSRDREKKRGRKKGEEGSPRLAIIENGKQGEKRGGESKCTSANSKRRRKEKKKKGPETIFPRGRKKREGDCRYKRGKKKRKIKEEETRRLICNQRES